ncbi:hypothetical protein [Leifsonia sp. Leaf264]|nr:hypothetical protein [Leifsonia sp. Leaf264]
MTLLGWLRRTSEAARTRAEDEAAEELKFREILHEHIRTTTI